MKPKSISIIITARNYGEFLAKAIQSCLGTVNHESKLDQNKSDDNNKDVSEAIDGLSGKSKSNSHLDDSLHDENNEAEPRSLNGLQMLFNNWKEATDNIDKKCYTKKICAQIYKEPVTVDFARRRAEEVGVDLNKAFPTLPGIIQKVQEIEEIRSRFRGNIRAYSDFNMLIQSDCIERIIDSELWVLRKIDDMHNEVNEGPITDWEKKIRLMQYGEDRSLLNGWNPPEEMVPNDYAKRSLFYQCLDAVFGGDASDCFRAGERMCCYNPKNAPEEIVCVMRRYGVPEAELKAQASKFYTHVRRGVWRFQDEFKTFSKSLDEIFTETKSVAQQDLSAIPHSETDIAVLKNQSEQLESAAGKIDRVRTSVLLTSGDEAKYYESVIAASKTILQNNPNTRMNTVGQHKELIREHGEPDIESSKICKACLICSATDQCNCYGPVEDRPSEVFGGQILTLNGALGGSDQVPTVNVGANSVEGSDLQRRKNDAMP